MADMAAYLESEPVTAQGAPQGTPPEASATCVACHGNEGVGILPEYPTLSGQYADYIEHALKEYRAGRRQNAIMAGFAAGLEDADIEALAAFFSAQTPGLCSTLDIRKHGKCQH
jgi:cytochrome c553